MIWLTLGVAVQTFSLPNGVRVSFRETLGSPLFAACLLYRCGVDEEESKPGLRAVAGWAMLQAASGQITRVESFGGRVRMTLGLDYVAFKAVAPLSASVDVLVALSTAASSSSFLLEEEVITWAKGRALREIRKHLDEPFYFSLLALRKVLYGGKGYGLPEWGKTEELGDVSLEEVGRFVKGRLVPQRAFLGVACDMSLPELLKLLGATLGLVEGGQPIPEPPPPRLSSQAWDGLTVKEGPGRLAKILVGFPGVSASSLDFPKTKVVSALLGGGLGGLAVRRLREEAGLAYRVISLCPTLEGEGFISLYAEVDPLKVEEATKLLLEVISEARAEGLSSADIERAKNRAIGEELLSLHRPSELAFKTALWEALGGEAGFERKFAEAVRLLPPREVMGAARRFLQRSLLVVVMPQIWKDCLALFSRPEALLYPTEG